MSLWPLVREFITFLHILYIVRYNIMDCLMRKWGKRGGDAIEKQLFPTKNTYQMCPTMHLKSPHGHQMAEPSAYTCPRKHIMVKWLNTAQSQCSGRQTFVNKQCNVWEKSCVLQVVHLNYLHHNQSLMHFKMCMNHTDGNFMAVSLTPQPYLEMCKPNHVILHHMHSMQVVVMSSGSDESMGSFLLCLILWKRVRQQNNAWGPMPRQLLCWQLPMPSWPPHCRLLMPWTTVISM